MNGGGVKRPVDQNTTGDGAVANSKKGTSGQQRKQHPPKRGAEKQRTEDDVRSPVGRDVNTQDTTRTVTSSGLRRLSHTKDVKRSCSPDPITEIQCEAGVATRNRTRRVNPPDSLCTLVSIGGTNFNEEKPDAKKKAGHNFSSDAKSENWTAAAASDTKGFKGKSLPPKVESPPSLSPAWILHRGGIDPKQFQQQRQQQRQQQTEKSLLTEDELSVFAGLAILDGNGGCGDDNDDDDGSVEYEDESVVVCPFRLVGSCVKGQHTEREMLSSDTIHSHLMSLAGLVHELRTEQRITEKECQKLHVRLESQKITIERLERYILAQCPASGKLLQTEATSPHEIGPQAPRTDAGKHPKGNILPGSILKPAQDRSVPMKPEMNSLSNGKLHFGGESFSERVRRKTSVETPAFEPCNAVATKKGEFVGYEGDRHGSVKYMAEELGTPVDLSRAALDLSQVSATGGASRKGANRHASGKQQHQKQGMPDWRGHKGQAQDDRYGGAVGVVDDSRGDVLSPIPTVVGLQDNDMSSNDDVVVAVASSVHPSGDAVQLPDLGERCTASSKVLLRKSNGKQNGTREKAKKRTIQGNSHSFGSSNEKTKRQGKNLRCVDSALEEAHLSILRPNPKTFVEFGQLRLRYHKACCFTLYLFFIVIIFFIWSYFLGVFA
ncbi:hypothetical protein ECC02_005606 [Trypanosoma cruzi]|uniref:Uncharacterized protein n=1 Tax=Trypanosoma cruzi TaxID=5693 RepID=A0A7J6Y3L9_TRYCR|nr:hypothetical protein ECC02_005606 [Trypanosoma cruzi]